MTAITDQYQFIAYDYIETHVVAFAEYFLMEPSEQYSGFMAVVREKTFMSNLVISFLIDNESASYEDLLQRLEVRAVGLWDSGGADFNEFALYLI